VKVAFTKFKWILISCRLLLTPSDSTQSWISRALVDLSLLVRSVSQFFAAGARRWLLFIAKAIHIRRNDQSGPNPTTNRPQPNPRTHILILFVFFKLIIHAQSVVYERFYFIESSISLLCLEVCQWLNIPLFFHNRRTSQHTLGPHRHHTRWQSLEHMNAFLKKWYGFFILSPAFLIWRL